MDKKILKEVILGLETDQNITINFFGERSALSGDYTVVAVRRGRGKGGSLLLEARSLDSGEKVEIGTPRSQEVLNVVVDGTLYGFESELEVPAMYETNTARAVELKQTFQEFMGVDVLPRNVEIDAPSAPEIHGAFTVTGARQLRGRHGQIVLTLQRDGSDESTDVWSYRHSGVINNFAVIK